MLSKIFTESKSKKKIFTTIFGVVFFALGLWLVQPAQKAEAISCSSGCDTRSSGECVWDWGQAANNTLQGRKTCAVGASYYDVWDLYDGWETSCNSGSGVKKCETGKCPSSTVNGATCNIIEPSGSIMTGGCSKNEIIGKWDASENKCIQCPANGRESQIYGSILSIGTIAGNNKFDSACPGVASQCDEKDVGCVGTSGYCKSPGFYTDCTGLATCSGTGASATCAAPSALTVSANPSTITKDILSSIVFTVTNASGSVAGAAVAISGAGISANCSSNTSSDGKCTASVTATSTGPATATASKTGSTPGSTTITVQAAPACPKGSGAGSGTSFAVGFKQSTFTTDETFKIFYTIPPEDQDGAICIYAPGASSPSYSKNETSTTVPKTNSNYDTGYKPTSAGTWKATISKGSFCSVASTCFATTTVTSVSPPPPPPPPPPPCIPTGAGCSQPADCCSNNCASGTCAAVSTASINFSTTCYQLTGTSVAATINYSGATLPAIIEINVLPPSTGTFGCVPLTTASGSISRNLDAIGSWRADIRSASDCWSPPGAVQASSSNITVQSTSCGGAVIAPSAGPCASGTTNYRSPLSYCSVQDLIQGATGWVLGLVSSIIILFLVYGGIMYTMAAGDETKMESAKNIIYYAILGLAIILISYTLITEVKTILKVK